MNLFPFLEERFELQKTWIKQNKKQIEKASLTDHHSEPLLRRLNLFSIHYVSGPQIWRQVLSKKYVKLWPQIVWKSMNMKILMKKVQNIKAYMLSQRAVRKWCFRNTFKKKLISYRIDNSSNLLNSLFWGSLKMFKNLLQLSCGK